MEINGGSLGHGLSVAVGMALAAKMNGSGSRVYVVMGDGELAEGQVWEAAMAASHYHLDNLCAVIDRNRLQISGSTEEVMHRENIARRWSSFGRRVIDVESGNDSDSLYRAFMRAKNNRFRPTVIIAETVKENGSKIMENKADWHHRVPTEKEYREMISGFQKRKEACRE